MAKLFWRAEVIREDRLREAWQIEQWGDAIKWYLAWLEACAEAGGDHRSLAERCRAAMHSAGSRRGLARRTKQWLLVDGWRLLVGAEEVIGDQ